VWKGYFKPRMFANEVMKAEEMKELPKHTYNTESVKNHFASDLAGMIFFVLIILAGSWTVYRRYTATGILNA